MKLYKKKEEEKEFEVKAASFLARLRRPHPLAPVVQKVDNKIQWINHSAVDNSIGFYNTFWLNSDFFP